MSSYKRLRGEDRESTGQALDPAAARLGFAPPRCVVRGLRARIDHEVQVRGLGILVALAGRGDDPPDRFGLHQAAVRVPELAAVGEIDDSLCLIGVAIAAAIHQAGREHAGV